MIRAATLTESITFTNEEPTGDFDRYGQAVTAPGDPTTVAAMLRPMKGMEDDAAQTRRTMVYRVVTAPVEGLTALSNVTWRGRRLLLDGEPLLALDRNGPSHLEFIAREVLGA